MQVLVTDCSGSSVTRQESRTWGSGCVGVVFVRLTKSAREEVLDEYLVRTGYISRTNKRSRDYVQ
jgi:hypothetical protein